MTLLATGRQQTDGEVIRAVCGCLTVLLALSAASAEESSFDTVSPRMAALHDVEVDAIGHDFDGKSKSASKWLTVGDVAKRLLSQVSDGDVGASADFRLFHLQSSGRAPLLISDVAKIGSLAKPADPQELAPTKRPEVAKPEPIKPSVNESRPDPPKVDDISGLDAFLAVLSDELGDVKSDAKTEVSPEEEHAPDEAASTEEDEPEPSSISNADATLTEMRSQEPAPEAFTEDEANTDEENPDEGNTDETESDSSEPNRRTVAEPPVKITRHMAALRPRIARTTSFYFDRPLNTRDDSAWSIMHSILGYGVDGTVAINGQRGRRTNAIAWMCSNNLCANRRLLYLDRGGYIRGAEGAGFQGHPGQFLAMLAQVNLRRDYPIRVQGRAFTVEDLVEAEMQSCSAERELTFKLIGISHYLQSDSTWKAGNGQEWDLSKLLEIELSQPVNGAACGGTHRLMAIAFAVRTKERRGESLEGPYQRAKKYIQDYQKYALSLQNRDGSFSSDWFKRRANWGDRDRQLQTTGHILEWLVYSLPRNELSDPRVTRSVDFLCNLMTRHRYHDWEVGPRGHALRALSLYQRRVYGQSLPPKTLAQRNTNKNATR